MFGQGGINYGVLGVVHTVSGPLIEATPIDEVLKYLEQFENNRLPFALFSGKWNRHRQRRHQAIFAEHTSTSSVAHSHVVYLGPVPPVSSNANESVEHPNFNHCWNGISGQNEIFTAHGFPVIDVQYQSWGHHSHPSSNSGHMTHIDRTDCASVAPATVRPTRVAYDDLTRFGSVLHPSFHGRGNSRSHRRTSVSRANGVHHQRQLSHPPGVPPPIIPLVRKPNGPRGLATSQPDRSGGLFNFPSPGPSSRNPHETYNWKSLSRFHTSPRTHIFLYFH